MARELIAKGTVVARPKVAQGEPIPPVTQPLPLFIGGPTIVAAEVHDMSNPDDLSKPIGGYKMFTSPTGYVWVPKEEADQLFAPADETNQYIIDKAIAQGLRVALAPPPEPPMRREKDKQNG